MHYAKAKSLAKVLASLQDDIEAGIIAGRFSRADMDPLLRLTKIVDEIVEHHAGDDVRERLSEVKD